MSYLRRRDYDRIIQDAELQQYLDTDAGIKTLAEQTALAKAKAHLKQKYYTDIEFTDTNIYTQTTKYTAWNRVELDFPAYVPANTYQIGAPVSNGSNPINQYICKTANTTGVFDASKFFLVGVQYDVWYLDYPYPLFQLMTGAYAVNDFTTWMGKIYQAAKPSPFFTESDRLEPIFDQNIPYPNIFPDDVKSGRVFWGTGQAYSIAGIAPGIPLSFWTAWVAGSYASGDVRSYNGSVYVSQVANNTSIPGADLNWLPVSWIQGDNRDQLVVDCLLALVIWDLSSRIMIDNSPKVREDAMERAMGLLKNLEHGVITADRLVIIQTGKGITTSFGGVTKTINVW